MRRRCVWLGWGPCTAGAGPWPDAAARSRVDGCPGGGGERERANRVETRGRTLQPHAEGGGGRRLEVRGDTPLPHTPVHLSTRTRSTLHMHTGAATTCGQQKSADARAASRGTYDSNSASKTPFLGASSSEAPSKGCRTIILPVTQKTHHDQSFCL